MPKPMSPTEHLVELVRASYLYNFSVEEASKLDDIGSRTANGVLEGAARINIRGGARKMIVGNPFMLCEGLIQFFTPTEVESSCVLSVEVIEGLYFSV